MANFVCFLAGRRAMLGEAARSDGPGAATAAAPGLRLGRHPHLDPEGVRPVRPGHRRDPVDSHRRRRSGCAPTCCASGFAEDLAARRPADHGGGHRGQRRAPARWIRSASWPRSAATHGLWFHVDGAYGAPAAVLPDAPDDLHALALADSLAVDPHKWLYAPLEAGCVLVREPQRLSRGVRLHARPTTGSRPRARSRRSTTTSSACRTAAASARSRSGSACARRDARATSRMIGDDCRLAAALHRARRPRTPSSRRRPWASASRPSATCPRDLRGAGGRAGGVSQHAQRGAARPAQDWAASCSSPTPWSTAASCCAPASSTSAPPRPTSRRSPRSWPRVGRAVDAELRPGRTRLGPTSSAGPRCCWSARTSS